MMHKKIPMSVIFLVAFIPILPVLAFYLQYPHNTGSWLRSINGLMTLAVLPAMITLTLRSWIKDFSYIWFIVFAIAGLAIVHGNYYGYNPSNFHATLILMMSSVGVGIYLHSDSTSIAKLLLISASLAGASLTFIIALIWLDTFELTSSQWTYDIPGFKNIRVIGQFASLSAMVAFPMIIFGKPRAVWILIALLSTMLLFWSGSRGGLLALSVSIAMSLACLLRDRRKGDGKGYIAAILAFTSGVVFSLVPPYPNHNFGLISRIETTGKLIASDRDPTSNRIDLWSWMIDAIFSNPITGNGFLRASQMGFSHVNSHNFVLDMLFGYGLIFGSLIVVLIFWLTYRTCWLAFRKGGRSMSVFAGVVIGTTIYALVEPILFSQIFCLAFAASTAAVYSYAKGSP